MRSLLLMPLALALTPALPQKLALVLSALASPKALALNVQTALALALEQALMTALAWPLAPAPLAAVPTFLWETELALALALALVQALVAALAWSLAPLPLAPMASFLWELEPVLVLAMAFVQPLVAALARPLAPVPRPVIPIGCFSAGLRMALPQVELAPLPKRREDHTPGENIWSEGAPPTPSRELEAPASPGAPYSAEVPASRGASVV